jgi:hypothetical protein
MFLFFTRPQADTAGSNFYINRAGRNLSAARRRKLEAAKAALRSLYRRKPRK